MIIIIACVGNNGELGYKNKLCFHIKEDMKFFREVTRNKSVLMGYNTWLSLGEKPLKDRTNYVLTKDASKLPDSVIGVDDLETFLNNWRYDDLFIIGGGSVYAQALDWADEIYLTEVDAECEADTFFPKFNKAAFTAYLCRFGQEDGLGYAIECYVRD